MVPAERIKEKGRGQESMLSLAQKLFSRSEWFCAGKK